jgi:hypothetical protein
MGEQDKKTMGVKMGIWFVWLESWNNDALMWTREWTKNTLVWDVRPCIPMFTDALTWSVLWKNIPSKTAQRVKAVHCLLALLTLAEAVSPSETTMNFHKTTRCQILKNTSLQKFQEKWVLQFHKVPHISWLHHKPWSSVEDRAARRQSEKYLTDINFIVRILPIQQQQPLMSHCCIPNGKTRPHRF